MVLRIYFFSIILIGLVSCSNNESKADVLPPETPEEKGASLFIVHCAACHGEDGKLGASGAKDLTMSKLSDEEIEKIIVNGKNAMPPMKVILENKENLALVIKHVKSFRK
ncbi:MAG: c-type cytochrome [Crocinitomicaceae bacterium]|jgi:mono/diheme cytochrome c family protein